MCKDCKCNCNCSKCTCNKENLYKSARDENNCSGGSCSSDSSHEDEEEGEQELDDHLDELEQVYR